MSTQAERTIATQHNMSLFVDMPEEILVYNILIQTDNLNVRVVCKLWKDTYDNSLYNLLVLPQQRVPDENKWKAIKRSLSNRQRVKQIVSVHPQYAAAITALYENLQIFIFSTFTNCPEYAHYRVF